MSAETNPTMPRPDRLALVVLSAFAAFCMLAAALVTAQVLARLDEYGSASRDNLQWTLSQLEVEQVRFRLALARLDPDDPATLTHLRRRFDLLYSRAMTLQRGDAYRQIVEEGQMQEEMREIAALLSQMVEIIDGSDEALLAGRTRLDAHAARMTGPVRAIATGAITVDARRSDAERAELTAQIVTLTVLILLMVAALFTLLVMLWRLYRSHLRRAEESRRTSHRLATILNTSQDAVLVTDGAGRVRETNTHARALFELPSPGSGEIRVETLISEGVGTDRTPMLGARLMAACNAGPYRSDSLTGHSMGGRSFAVELSADVALRQDAPVCICFVRDISARRAVEAEIASARDRALAGERAKARFLGMISHEMRTPLNGMLGALDLLDETGLTPEQEGFARIMRASGKLLLTQITDALDIVQAEAGKLRLQRIKVDLDQLLHDLIESQRAAAAARGNHLRLLTPETGLGHVEGDPDRLNQVLLNLLSNAIKFTQDGEITLEATRDHAAGRVEFQVSDTGVGISQVDLPHVFDDFMRVEQPGDEQPEGTGLGLGIARQLVALMGGRIGAESELGEGSLFWVRLPLPGSAGPGSARPPRAQTVAPQAGPARVLLVEDNPTNRLVIETMLSRDGHAVTLACDGVEGVEAARAAAYDLILMDINMPRMDGIEATRAIRAGGGPCAGARIVALTAFADGERAQTLIAAGLDDFKSKPLSREALRAILAGDGDAPQITAGGSCPGPPCLDHACLDQLRATLPEARFSEILQRFETEASRLIATLDEGRTAPDADLAARVHRLAGSAAICGAPALHAGLAEAEAALRAGDHAARSAHLAALPDLWRRTRAALAGYRGTL